VVAGNVWWNGDGGQVGWVVWGFESLPEATGMGVPLIADLFTVFYETNVAENKSKLAANSCELGGDLNCGVQATELDLNYSPSFSLPMFARYLVRILPRFRTL
jgi:hypothetical protein